MIGASPAGIFANATTNAFVMPTAASSNPNYPLYRDEDGQTYLDSLLTPRLIATKDFAYELKGIRVA